MYIIIWSPFITDPCAEIKCGENAICKVVYATGKAFCSCPYLMVGNPYEICGELYCNLGENTVIKKSIIMEYTTLTSRHSLFIPFYQFQRGNKVSKQVSKL